MRHNCLADTPFIHDHDIIMIPKKKELIRKPQAGTTNFSSASYIVPMSNGYVSLIRTRKPQQQQSKQTIETAKRPSQEIYYIYSI